MSTRDARGRFTASGAPGSATGGSGSDGDDDNTGGDGPAVPQGGTTDAKPERASGVRDDGCSGEDARLGATARNGTILRQRIRFG